MTDIASSSSTPRRLSLLLFGVLLGVWFWATREAPFDASRYTEAELRLMEFNGDILRKEDGRYIFHPKKRRGFPSPYAVWEKATEEIGQAFERNGPNDHGIGLLILYTAGRFFVGFFAAVLVGIAIGIALGLHPLLYGMLNPYLQILKTISPLAWMPLLLATVRSSDRVTVLIVFLTAIWPMIANTSFGVKSMPKEYLHVALLLEMTWLKRLWKIILPASAPAILVGLRIGFGSALVAVVPAEMLTGELGVGNYTWVVWNDGDLAGVIFGIGVIGILGWMLDGCVTWISRFFHASD